MLTDCPEHCGAKVSTKADRCPQCGCPITEADVIAAAEEPFQTASPVRLGAKLDAKLIPPAPTTSGDKPVDSQVESMFGQTGFTEQEVPDEETLDKKNVGKAARLFGNKNIK